MSTACRALFSAAETFWSGTAALRPNYSGSWLPINFHSLTFSFSLARGIDSQKPVLPSLMRRRQLFSTSRSHNSCRRHPYR